MPKEQYILNWHDGFVNGIKYLLATAVKFSLLPEATDDDKQQIELFKLMLKGKDAKTIEKELAEGLVNHNTFDKIEKLNKEILDFIFEQKSEIWKMLLKQQCYFNIEMGKKVGQAMLNELGI